MAITVEKNVNGIEGLCVITPKVFGDERGYFMETYNYNDFKEGCTSWITLPEELPTGQARSCNLR